MSSSHNYAGSHGLVLLILNSINRHFNMFTLYQLYYHSKKLPNVFLESFSPYVCPYLITVIPLKKNSQICEN